MSSHLTTLETIGAILSFKSDTQLLEKKIRNNEINWDRIVTIGSAHLVLPALYCRLNKKSLSQYIPKDLFEYLAEITSINRNRNVTILKEVKHISQLFNSNNIEHVFLKGSALLAANYYEDLGERMIGDIDILVAPDQLQKAQAILVKQAYQSMDKKTLFHLIFEHHHLPRLVNKNTMAAVEIHRKVLIKPYKDYLKPDTLLKEKSIVNGIAILKPAHLLEHCILNLQINDKGNYNNYCNFRTAFDTLVILKQLPKINLQKEYGTSCFQNYFSIHSLFLKDFNYKPIAISSKIQLQIFKFKTQRPIVQKSWNKALTYMSLLSKLINRSWHFIFNKPYRKDLIKDRNRVFKEEIKAKL